MDGEPVAKQCPNCGISSAYNAPVCSCGFRFPALPPSGFSQPTQYQNQVVDQNRWLIALLLVVFLGHLGIHRFYMGYTTHGVIILVLQVIGWVTACIFIGFLFLAAVGVWWLIDLILIATNGLKMADGTSLR